ncbi:MAG: DDE-type integrase/transposase/recombinase [Bacteroidia bacterium]|nr:DDE-type integrase/transposase/recombinase [Bacteroidia bacterium]
MNFFFWSIGYSKQSLHQYLNRQLEEMETFGYLEIIVHQIRKRHPTLAMRSIYELIKPPSMGRDKFIAYCSEIGLLNKKKFKPLRTTDSSGVIRFPNLILGLSIDRINQVWSSDITYYQIGSEVYYITFIIDNFSRVIVGWHVSESLRTEETTLPALMMAVKNRKKINLIGLIFHSDGGGQYFAKIFLEYTRKMEFQNSMCEYAYENGKAERINGVIKNNYLRHWPCSGLYELAKNVDRACTNYNVEKPHKALKMLSPITFEEKYLSL